MRQHGRPGAPQDQIRCSSGQAVCAGVRRCAACAGGSYHPARARVTCVNGEARTSARVQRQPEREVLRSRISCS